MSETIDQQDMHMAERGRGKETELTRMLIAGRMGDYQPHEWMLLPMTTHRYYYSTNALKTLRNYEHRLTPGK